MPLHREKKSWLRKVHPDYGRERMKKNKQCAMSLSLETIKYNHHLRILLTHQWEKTIF